MSGWRKYGTTIYDEQWSHDDLDLLAWHSGGRWRWCCSSTGGFAPCRLSALLRAEAASRVAVMPPAETTGMGRVGHRWRRMPSDPDRMVWDCKRCGATKVALLPPPQGCGPSVEYRDRANCLGWFSEAPVPCEPEDRR